MKMAAIYARVSSQRQREEQTIDSQTAALVRFAQDEGYTVPQEWVFEDEGYSGSRLDRPGLERVRDLAAEAQIEVVLVYSPDRLSRKYAYQVLLLEELGRQGVEVQFIQSPQARTPEERLLVHFQGMIAEYERAQIAERTRRGKRHRAKAGSVSVLSGAPYGYRYIKKTQISEACYQVIECEAEVVREVYKLYTQDQLSIGAIVRRLNDKAIATRRKASRWERSTVWGMLRNPAYKGTACFGKTEAKEREKITRPLRRRGGHSPRCSANREKPREEWIEIPVPAIVDEESFELAQEQLEKNKRYSRRRTIEPTLLQSLLVCRECGYALYRSSTRTSKRKLYYYRCTGSDNYRHPNGRVCSNRPVRQDYLDEVVWKQVVELLQDPTLIRQEIGRRIEQIQNSDPTKRRQEALSRELARVCKGMGKLLDAYQEDLVQLEELRKRMPALRKREKALKLQLQSLEAAAVDQEILLRLADGLEHFLTRLRQSADTMSVTERQKVLRLVVKEIHVGRSTIWIKHSIPVTGPGSIGGVVEPSKAPSYLLRSGRHHTTLRRALVTMHKRSVKLLGRRFEPSFDVQQDPSTVRKVPHRPQDKLVVQVVKEAAHVQIQNPVKTPASLASCRHCIQS